MTGATTVAMIAIVAMTATDTVAGSATMTAAGR